MMEEEKLERKKEERERRREGQLKKYGGKGRIRRFNRDKLALY